MINSFGISTRPLEFRRSTPALALHVFRGAIREALGSLSDDFIAVSRTESEWWDLLGESGVAESELIKGLRSALQQNGIDEAAVVQGLQKRAELIARQVKPFVVGRRLLDWGCGDGFVAEEFQRGAAEVELLDIVDARRCLIDRPFFVYDEDSLPVELAAEPFDTVLLLTVLHHARNPGRTLHHAALASAQRIVIIESVPELDAAPIDALPDERTREGVRYEYCGFVDWMYNRVFHDEVQVTYNYLGSMGWEQMFEASGFRLVTTKTLGVDQPLAPEWHVLQVYDKRV